MRQKFLFNIGENRFIYNNDAPHAAPEEKPRVKAKTPKDDGQKKAGEDYISKAQERIFTQEVSVEAAEKAIAETERLLSAINKNLVTSSGAADALKPYEIMAGMTRNEKTNLPAGDYARALYRSIRLLQTDLGVKADGMMGAETLTALLEKGSQPNATERVRIAKRSFTLSGNIEQTVLAKAKKQASEAALARAPKAPRAQAAALASTETAPMSNADRAVFTSLADTDLTRDWYHEVGGAMLHINPGSQNGIAGVFIGERGQEQFYSQAQIDALRGKPAKTPAQADALASTDTGAPAPVETDAQKEKNRVLKYAISMPNGFTSARSDRVADFQGAKTRIEYIRNTRSYTVTVDGKSYEYTQAEVDAATKKPKAAEAAPLASTDTRTPEKIDEHAAMLKAAANFIIDNPSEENQTFKYKGQTINILPTGDGFLIGKENEEDFYSKETLSGLAAS